MYSGLVRRTAAVRDSTQPAVGVSISAPPPSMPAGDSGALVDFGSSRSSERESHVEKVTCASKSINQFDKPEKLTAGLPNVKDFTELRQLREVKI